MRTNIMRECAKEISGKLLYLNKTMRKSILEMRSLCCKLEGIELFDHRFIEAVKLN